MTTEIAKVNPTDYELTTDKASEIESAFAPKIAERESLVKEYDVIISGVIDKDLCTQAGSLRKKLVKIRTGIGAIHKTQKNMFLQAGRFVDAWKNAETLPVTQMEERLSEIEKHYENIEAERITKLNAERTNILEGLECEFIPAGLSQMDDNVWDSFLSGEITKRDNREAEAVKVKEAEIAKEKADAEERERMAKENEKLKAEAEERAKAEAVRIAEARKESDRIEAERARDREEAEAKLEFERKERAKAEAEKAEIEADAKAKVAADAKEKANELVRQRDKKHRGEINNAAMKCFIDTGLDEFYAKAAVKAIVSGKVDNVSIKY